METQISLKQLDELIVEYKKGNEDAFDLIYFETKKSVYLSIRLIISRKEDVEDLMQDTYIKALENLDNYKLGTNFKAWISRIARNNAINYYNKNKRIVLVEDIIPDNEISSPKLNHYLSFLDGEERDVIIYKLILQMSFKEISKIIDKPISTTHYIYKKSISKIRKEVQYED